MKVRGAEQPSRPELVEIAQSTLEAEDDANRDGGGGQAAAAHGKAQRRWGRAADGALTQGRGGRHEEGRPGIGRDCQERAAASGNRKAADGIGRRQRWIWPLLPLCVTDVSTRPLVSGQQPPARCRAPPASLLLACLILSSPLASSFRRRSSQEPAL